MLRPVVALNDTICRPAVNPAPRHQTNPGEIIGDCCDYNSEREHAMRVETKEVKSRG